MSLSSFVGEPGLHELSPYGAVRGVLEVLVRDRMTDFVPPGATVGCLAPGSMPMPFARTGAGFDDGWTHEAVDVAAASFLVGEETGCFGGSTPGRGRPARRGMRGGAWTVAG